MGKSNPFIFNRSFALALVTISLALLVGPVRAGLDENGYPDLVFANFTQKNRICQPGLFSFSCGDVSDDTDYSTDVALGYVDGDQHLDIVIATDAPTENRLCLGDGSGGFSCRDLSNEQIYSYAVALGDIDGDGDLDAVFANFGLQNSLCLNDGSGGFTCGDVSDDANNSSEVALGYVDGDQHLDAVFANTGEKSRLCLGDGSGGFDCRDLGDLAYSALGVALGDLDGDGHLDAVFAAADGFICRGDGSGLFNCSKAATMTNAMDVALGHLDGDGKLDAVFADYDDQNTVCLGAGDGGFSSCRHANPDDGIYSGVALGDLDGDGYLDAVFANYGSRNPICIGDGSGGFNCSTFSDDRNYTQSVAITNDGQAPQVVDVWLVIGAGGTANQINQIAVRFSENVVDGDGPQGAENPHNYLVTQDGDPLTISSVDYSPQHRTAILTLAEALGDGEIEVTVMGSTSIVDIDNHKLDGGSGTGSDFTLAFSMDLGLGGGTGGGGGGGGGSGSGGGRAAGAAATASSMPGTGFAPGVYTPLAAQPEAQAYRAAGDLRLEVPALGIDAEVMGVPFADGEWDVSWLGARVGWLEGSAYPATAGNTALTGHLVDNNGRPGPFARLGELSYGDTLVLHSGGNTYTYSVRESLTVFPDDTSPLGHEDYDWLTLITCQGYDEASGHYGFRRVVRAVLLQVSPD